MPVITSCSRLRWSAALGLAAVVLAGCGGPQSTLHPAGREAADIAQLFWWLSAGAVLVWVAVIGAAIYAVRVRPGSHSKRTANVLIIGGGVVLPVLVLAVYLVYGLAMLPRLVEPLPEGSLTIEVTGEQWWWRVHYKGEDGGVIPVANEIHLPVDERVQFLLASPDVIHAFWIPSIGGKIDVIPGRTTRLALEPTERGVFRGACAEYCGSSHALMNFDVVVEEREDFERWLEQQAAPAREPASGLTRRGRAVFLSNGCGACHAVRGTEADGTVGPDLTHVGSRRSIGAGILPNEPDQFLRWIAETEEVKPDVHMPAFGMLPAQDLRALAAYLDELE